MTPHREWFYEYESYNGNSFLGEHLAKNVTTHGRVKFFLNDGRIKTFPHAFHILGLAKNLISFSKTVDIGVKTLLKKDRLKMV